jgi:hypothetical protein
MTTALVRRVPGSGILATLALALSPAAALAAGPVYNVTTSAVDAPDAVINGVCETAVGNGVCTLRAAVMEANLGPNLSAEQVTINLPAGTYLFTRGISNPDDHSNGDLNVQTNVRIVGSGTAVTVIDANHLDRAFAVAATGSLTLSDLTVQGGRPPDNARGRDGGGISNVGGSVTLLRCVVRDNATVSAGLGGGISSVGGTLNVTDSAIRLNVAGGAAGIYAYNATVNVLRTTLNTNTGTFADLGYWGGGIGQVIGTVNVVNSTISGNSAASGGSGLSAYGGHTYLNNVTIAANTAGQVLPRDGSNVVFSNSIVASGPITCSSGDGITTNGYNAFKDVTCTFVNGGYQHVDIALGALGSYGGLTATHSLLPGSPAINAGHPSGCVDPVGTPLTTDQRGVKRPIGAACDLGAFEAEPIGDANGDGVVGVSDVFYVINYLFAGGAPPLGRANVNGDSAVNVNDVFYLINYLFAGGSAPV